ncbi:fibrobacter succinogenes major paralogous domain-containing protein [Croceimicrobium sp.]|uniref:fibrobacter succinogenes major paralogous domain-containing protein n=1 Tax=Croceimicrobium sp. TaxID=2828340 RepID=UPI003BA87578
MKAQTFIFCLLLGLSLPMWGQYPERQFSLAWLEGIYSNLNPQKLEELKDHRLTANKKGKQVVKELSPVMEQLQKGGFFEGGLDLNASALTGFDWNRRVFHFKADHPNEAPALIFSLAIELDDPSLCESWRLAGSPKAAFTAPKKDADLLHFSINQLLDEASKYHESQWLPEKKSERAEYHQLKSTFKYTDGARLAAWEHMDNPEKRDFFLDLKSANWELQDMDQRNALAMIEMESILSKMGKFKAISVEVQAEGESLHIVRTYQSEAMPMHIIKVDFGPENQNIWVLDVKTPLNILIPPGGPKDASGNSYTALSIGDQTWTGPNASSKHFRNGDAIPVVEDANLFYHYMHLGIPVACYPNFDEKNAAMGLLYSSDVLWDPRGLAPIGYRIPGAADWQALLDFIDHPKEASFLKSKEGWYKESFSNDHYGFSAPGAGRIKGKNASDFEEEAAFWAFNQGANAQEPIQYLELEHGDAYLETKVADHLKNGLALSLRFIKIQ